MNRYLNNQLKQKADLEKPNRTNKQISMQIYKKIYVDQHEGREDLHKSRASEQLKNIGHKLMRKTIIH